MSEGASKNMVNRLDVLELIVERLSNALEKISTTTKDEITAEYAKKTLEITSEFLNRQNK